MSIDQPTIAPATSSMPSEPAKSTDEARWETALRKIVIVIGRIALAYLFFTQLWWKLPPTYGCPASFEIKKDDGKGGYTKSSGLCTYLGYESIFADKGARKFLVAELKYWPQSPIKEISVDLTPLTRLNGQIIDSFIAPNLRWFGSVIWWSEFFIFASLFLGLLSRLGGLVALGVSVQLTLGLAGVPIPGDYEWEWAYINIVVMAVMMIGLAPGRIFGLDAVLRRLLKPAADRGNLLAKLLLLPT
jgi:uncharacterized membrane protein YphA (DoxX/SURF4 family)